SAPYHAGPAQFPSSIASSRGSLHGPERDSYKVPRHRIGDTLFGRNRSRKPKKRTGFRGTMSGDLKLGLASGPYEQASFHMSHKRPVVVQSVHAIRNS